MPQKVVTDHQGHSVEFTIALMFKQDVRVFWLIFKVQVTSNFFSHPVTFLSYPVRIGSLLICALMELALSRHEGLFRRSVSTRIFLPRKSSSRRRVALSRSFGSEGDSVKLGSLLSSKAWLGRIVCRKRNYFYVLHKTETYDISLSTHFKTNILSSHTANYLKKLQHLPCSLLDKSLHLSRGDASVGASAGVE